MKYWHQKCCIYIILLYYVKHAWLSVTYLDPTFCKMHPYNGIWVGGWVGKNKVILLTKSPNFRDKSWGKIQKNRKKVLGSRVESSNDLQMSPKWLLNDSKSQKKKFKKSPKKSQKKSKKVKKSQKKVLYRVGSSSGTGHHFRILI